MSNELKQLDSLRRQAAKIKAYILALQECRNLTKQQAVVIEELRQAFNRIIYKHLKAKRKEFNDEHPGKLDMKLDCYDNTLDKPRLAQNIINDIIREIKELYRLANFVCDSNSDPLITAIHDIQCFELGELRYLFNDKELVEINKAVNHVGYTVNHAPNAVHGRKL